MSESTTERLNKRLRSISKKDFSDYLFQLKQAPSLYDFFNLYMKKHHLSMAEIIKNSLIARNYGYEILNGKKFEDVAAAVSLCPSGANGGDLGFFGKGVMVKEFEDAAFSMNIGDLSEPIQTQFGWHLLYLTDKKD